MPCLNFEGVNKSLLQHILIEKDFYNKLSVGVSLLEHSFTGENLFVQSHLHVRFNIRFTIALENLFSPFS